MFNYRVSVRPPGSLGEDDVRALWRLRRSMLRLKPMVDPARDYERFSSFVRRSHVGRVKDRCGRVVATMSNLRLDGRFEGQAYRLSVFEYAFNEVHVRRHPAVVAMYILLFYGCRRWRPGVRNYLCFAGYPTTVLSYSKRLPELKLDGDRALDPLERYLIGVYAEQVLGDRFDRERRVVWMPTIPPAPRPEWLARNREEPLLVQYLARSPRWREGESVIALSRLDDGLRLVWEFGARLLQRGPSQAEPRQRQRIESQR